MTMTVGQLIDALQQFEDDVPVHITYNYGDYWRTQVAPAASSVEESFVKYSDYHRMHEIADDDSEDEEDGVLSCVTIG